MVVVSKKDVSDDVNHHPPRRLCFHSSRKSTPGGNPMELDRIPWRSWEKKIWGEPLCWAGGAAVRATSDVIK
jgi:hypothetical protein